MEKILPLSMVRVNMRNTVALEKRLALKKTDQASPSDKSKDCHHHFVVSFTPIYTIISGEMALKMHQS
jgi:hypothetical protein